MHVAEDELYLASKAATCDSLTAQAVPHITLLISASQESVSLHLVLP